MKHMHNQLNSGIGQNWLAAFAVRPQAAINTGQLRRVLSI